MVGGDWEGSNGNESVAVEEGKKNKKRLVLGRRGKRGLLLNVCWMLRTNACMCICVRVKRYIYIYYIITWHASRDKERNRRKRERLRQIIFCVFFCSLLAFRSRF